MSAMYDGEATVEAVALALIFHLWIIRITSEEASYLINDLGLKTRMP